MPKLIVVVTSLLSAQVLPILVTTSVVLADVSSSACGGLDYVLSPDVYD